MRYILTPWSGIWDLEATHTVEGQQARSASLEPCTQCRRLFVAVAGGCGRSGSGDGAAAAVPARALYAEQGPGERCHAGMLTTGRLCAS
jgi:hypothetical protein